MRQSVKQIGHAAALIVNQEKSHIVRTEIDGKRQKIGLQYFGLPGTCGACHQAVRAMVFLVHIQIAGAAALLSDQRLHGITGTAFPPSCFRMKFRGVMNAIHLKKAQCGRHFPALLLLVYFYVSQCPGQIFQLTFRYKIKPDGNPLFQIIRNSIHPLKCVAVFDHIIAGVGKFLIVFHQQYGGQTNAFFILYYIGRNQFSFQQFRICHH